MTINRKYFNLFLLSFLCAVLNILYFEKSYIDFNDIVQANFNFDGYNTQLIYAYRFIFNGFSFDLYELSSELILVHVIRLFTTLPFFISEEIFGSAGQTIFIYLFILWSIRGLINYSNAYCFIPMLIFPLLFSWRSTLVICSVFLFVSFYLNSKSGWFDLFVSFTLASLSSASLVFIFLSIIYLYFYRKSKFQILYFILFLYLAAMFLIVLHTKYIGFSIGAPGYSVEGAGAVESMLLRSTIIIKILEGDVLRKTFYTVFVIIVSILLIKIFFERPIYKLNVLIFISMFGVFVEGMGVMVIAGMILLYCSGIKKSFLTNSVK